MLSDRNILRKVKTELDRMTRPFNERVRKLEVQIRSMSAKISKLSRDLKDKIEPNKD